MSPKFLLIGPKRQFLAFVALPALIFAAGLIWFGIWSLWVTAEKTDHALRDQQVEEVHSAIGATLDELAQSQAGVAIWDLAVDKLQTEKVDLDWFDQNVGVWFNYVFGHELDIIVDGQDRPLYAMQGGVRVSPRIFETVKPDLAPLIHAARSESGRAANPHERLANRPLSGDTSVRTSAAAVHATDLVSLNGQPAAASVMRMIPDSRYSDAPPGQEPLVISVRYLQTGLMRRLQQERGLVDAHVSDKPVSPRAGYFSLPLTSSQGKRIGYFTWRPAMPGEAILRSMLIKGSAALAALLALLTALVAGVGWLMRRDARSIEALQQTQLELQAKEAQAQYLANHDPLTSLPNRAAFSKAVDEAIARIRNGRLLGVLLIDLDRFKQVNDTLGHLAGDRLIQAVAARLSHVAGDDDIVARLGGDEFAICMTDCGDRDAFACLAQAVLAELRQPFEILGTTVHVGGSIGISVCSSAASDRVELLRKADIAMYRAKEGGRDGFRFFGVEMDESIARRRELDADLRIALETGEGLYVAYQPKLSSRGSKIVGLEALVRWNHPRHGALAPDAFIPVAEESGLIDQLGEWVLREACRVARKWPRLSVAVNVSPVQFRGTDMALRIHKIVYEAGVSPRQIELEVTEGILVEDDEEVRGAIKHLRSAGFRIALDDFGTGYSSLSYLKKFTVDRIKIDKSFVKRLGQEPEAIAIVQAVIALGHAMALSVTAEGVETSEQERLLQTAGCNELQGFLFAPALLEAELAEWLERPFQSRIADGGAKARSA